MFFQAFRRDTYLNPLRSVCLEVIVLGKFQVSRRRLSWDLAGGSFSEIPVLSALWGALKKMCGLPLLLCAWISTNGAFKEKHRKEKEGVWLAGREERTEEFKLQYIVSTFLLSAYKYFSNYGGSFFFLFFLFLFLSF